jgi:hypothetical protein
MLQHASASTDAFRLIRRRLCRVLRLSTPHLPVLSSAPTNGFMPSKKGSWCLSLARREKLAGKRWRFRYVARTALFIRAYGDKTWLARTIPLGSRTELRSGSGNITRPSSSSPRWGVRSSKRTASSTGAIGSDQQVGSAPDVETWDQTLPIPDCLEPMTSSRPRRHAKTTPAFGSVAGGQDNAARTYIQGLRRT